jgi:hypothetical protein
MSANTRKGEGLTMEEQILGEFRRVEGEVICAKGVKENAMLLCILVKAMF